MKFEDKNLDTGEEWHRALSMKEFDELYGKLERMACHIAMRQNVPEGRLSPIGRL